MSPRKSKRINTKAAAKEHDEISEILIEVQKSESEIENYLPRQSSTEYFEFNNTDLKAEKVEQESRYSAEIDSDTSRPTKPCQKTFSRKIKLIIRKIHLICELKAAQCFVKHQMKNQNLAGLVLSGLPPHILRIFDPIMISEGKSLKNSMSMLVTWWKNNIGSRMLPTGIEKIRLHPRSKVLELKSAFFSKSAYEDDSVRLFSIICHALGIKVRFVHSLDMIPASTTKTSNSNLKKYSRFQHCPQFWIEIYSSFDERWVSVDCIQGLVDEKTRLENKLIPHSFVIAVDFDGKIFDLTEKYASEFLERSFRLRKDEDKWFRDLLMKLNSENNTSFQQLPDRDQIIIKTEQKELIELPKTLSAIKNHPVLMLASQLKKYEVFYPATDPVGFFKDEPVFLRETVKKVRSKDAWLSQCARVVITSEEPIKLVNLPRKAGAPEDIPTGVQPLYGEWQTEEYVPPEVIDGKVPRNDHGNVDLFQPSMLPKTCVHVTLPSAWKVARHIGIDYADACIGFSFHGGRALPAIHGIVITDESFNTFQSEYKNKLIESFKSDSADLEKQISHKWGKIIKNALIARRLKHDSSMSISESLINQDNIRSREDSHEDRINELTISAFISSVNSVPHESEIEEFDAI